MIGVGAGALLVPDGALDPDGTRGDGVYNSTAMGAVLWIRDAQQVWVENIRFDVSQQLGVCVGHHFHANTVSVHNSSQVLLRNW